MSGVLPIASRTLLKRGIWCAPRRGRSKPREEGNAACTGRAGSGHPRGAPCIDQAAACPPVVLLTDFDFFLRVAGAAVLLL